MHVKPFARGVYGAAKAGLLGPEAQADAEAIGLTGSVLGREAAMVFSGGFAPYEKDVQDAKREISALLGPKANKATVGALKRLLEARIQKATKALPFAGGKDNPYQLEPTPLDEWNRLAEPTAEAKASGSLPPGAKEVR